MGGEIGVDAAPEGGSAFWFHVPSIMVEAAPADQILKDIRVAVMSPNRMLAAGLSAQIRSLGGDVVGVSVAAGDRVDALLIDGGTGTEPEPVVQPQAGVPAFLLVTPAARSRLESVKAMGFAGYLVKPLRQSAMAEQLLEVRARIGTVDKAGHRCRRWPTSRKRQCRHTHPWCWPPLALRRLRMIAGPAPKLVSAFFWLKTIPST